MNENAKIVFARNLRAQMDKKGISQADLVVDLNIKQSTLSDWLNAKKYPRIDKMQMLADYFKVLKSDLTEDFAPATIATAEAVEAIIKNELGREPTVKELEWFRDVIVSFLNGLPDKPQ